MRVVVFRQEGGFAAVPGLSRSVTVDEASLPPDEGSELRALLRAPPSRAKKPRRGADLRSYHLEVHEEGRCVRSITLADPVPERFAALIRWLAQAGRPG